MTIKMFSIFNIIRSAIFGHKNDNLDEEYDRAIQNILSDEEEIQELPVKNEDDQSFCSHRTGIVTILDTDYGFIDDVYYFDTKVVTVPGVNLKSRVGFILYKVKDSNKLEVSKIYKVLDNNWDMNKNNPDNFKSSLEKSSKLITRNIISQVVERKQREVILSPYDVTINLDNIETQFIPCTGDWVVIEALTEIDEDCIDLTGEILRVKQIYPLRSKQITGTVNIWDPTSLEGIINTDVYFNKESCEPGYIPCAGDKIVGEIIESTQQQLIWRALTIIPAVNNTENVHNSDNSIQNVIDHLTENKNGIEISDQLKFKDLCIGDRAILKVIVKNVSDERRTLVRLRFHSKRSASQLILRSHELDDEILLTPKQEIEFVFQCNAKFIGNTRELFVFTFRGFKIGRWFEINVTNGRSIPQNEKYVRQNHVKMTRKLIEHRNVEIYQGTRLIKPPAFVPIKMALYAVPNCLWDVVIGKENFFHTLEQTELEVEKMKPCLKFDLNPKFYAERFETLLYFEEIQMHINMRAYDMEDCRFLVNGEYMVLEIQNLYERRPSLMIGDRVFVYHDLEVQNAKHEGYIHKIHAKHIYLKFSNSFHSRYNGEEYNIQFLFMRTTLRRCHQAVRLAMKHLGIEFLFPTRIIEKPVQISFSLEDDFDNLKSKRKTQKNISEQHIASGDTQENRHRSEKSNSILNKRQVNFISVEKENEMATNKLIDNKGPLKSCNRETHMPVKTNKKDCKEKPDNLNKLNRNRTLKLYWLNKQLNYQQKEAVKNILKGVARPLPYIIFGPPGTGKTVTLVETVLQILRMLPGSRLLVTSPSNSSADLLALRILDSGVLKPGDLVRLVAHRCVVEGTIPERLIPYCATGELAREGTRREQDQTLAGARLGCTTTVLGRHRITVATCVSLGQLYNMGLPRNHFTHVLVDEAGQATEPEVLIPLTLLNTETGQVVLAGDPLQLGPVVMSRLAERYGMSESLLERLIRRFPYARDACGFPNTGGYDPRLITRLAINYRSVPEILNLPSSLFYDSELKPVVSQTEGPEADILNKLATELPHRKDKTPPAVVFHGVRGENLQQSDCPSWYNPHEATQVYFYMNRFYKLGLTADDIGIITPYSKQVQQIRALLSTKEFDLPKIGSVEEFQGQERNVIILSSVRSTTSLNPAELKNTLGFIASPRRFNVALTRAKALIVIIGNPHVLAHDPYWRSALLYCIKNNAYVGCDLPTQYMDMEDYVS